ncbi:MAG TPA: phage tail protein [Opitutaceae bacterium]|nr:phage tail protein [Opitutaceae bacterium]
MMNKFSKLGLIRSRTGILSGLLVLTVLAVLPVRAVAAAVPEVQLAAVRFVLSIDGHEVASFSELQGLTTEIDVIETSGPPPRTVSVTLKRGLTRNIEMSAWHELVILGDVAAARKSCSLTMYNTNGDPVVRFHLTDAWPSKVEIGSFKDKSGASVLTETITMTCEFIQRVAI